MKYSETAVKVANYAWETFKEIVEEIRTNKEFPNDFTFNIYKDDECTYKLFINGNRVIGEDYFLNCWKKVPILSCEMNYYAQIHPTMAGKEWLYLNLNYSGFWGSDYGTMEYVNNGFIKKQMGIAIRTAIKDFTQQHEVF